METEKVVTELNWLVENGHIASYAIGGAVGAFQYIEPSFTEDLDVFVAFRAADGRSFLDPLGPIWAELIKRGAKQVGERLVIGSWPVQFLPDGRPLYDEAIAHAEERPFGKELGRVISAPYLVLLALESGRGKDFVRVDEFLSRKVVDQSMLMPLIERFGLSDQWKKFETRFLSTNA